MRYVTGRWLAMLLVFSALGLCASLLPAEADDACPSVEEAAFVQGSGPEIYLLQQGALRWIPDLATLQALGYPDTAVTQWSDGCLGMLPLADPLPSVLPEVPSPLAAAQEPSSIPIPPAVTATPPGSVTRRLGPTARSGVPTDSALILTAGAEELPVNATLTLTARATEPEVGSYTLTIQRLRSPGGPAGGLVANCSGSPTCVGQTRGSEPGDVSYLATLYRCDARGACAAERSSNTVTVRWR